MGNNTFTEQFADGTTLTQSQLETALQSLQPNISNMALSTTGSSSGQVMTSNGSNTAPSFQAVSDPLGPFAQRNYGLLASASAGALKIYLKTHGNATPSAGSFVDITTSNNGTSFGTYTNIEVEAATSIIIPQSATLGYTANSGLTQRVHIYGYISSGTTVFLAVSARPDLDTGAVVAAIGINASAKSSGALYATASTNVLPRLLGWVESTINASSQWQTATACNVTNNYKDSVSLHRYNTPSNQADIGQLAISSSSGQITQTSTSSTAITNLSVTLTTSGRPVLVALVSDGSGNDSRLEYAAVAGETATFVLVRDSTIISAHDLRGANGGQIIVPCSLCQIDVPTAGTHTYTAKMNTGNSSGEVIIYFSKIIAIEL